VEQSTRSWRVFDGPSAPSGDDRGGRKPDGPTSTVAVQPIALLGIAGAVLIGAAAIAIAMTASDGAVIDGPADVASALESGRAPAAEGGLVIDVTGAVVSPGVYELSRGARLGDAIEAAGGFSSRVDADRVAAELNLAAPLTDGAQIHVPSRDEAHPPTGGGATGGGGTGGGNAPRINLNTATQAELESLPGIGPVTAGKIMEARAQAPFRTVDELRERGLVGEKTFESLRALVTVG
jgi:competence protein ComEA